MSETPTMPTTDPTMDQVTQYTNERIASGSAAEDFSQWEYENSQASEQDARVLNNAENQNSQGEMYEHFERWETEVAETPRPPEFKPWNLNEDEPTSENLWTREEYEAPVAVIERIEEAKPVRSRAEEVGMLFHGLTDAQKRQRFDALTKAIGSLHPIR